MLITFLGHQSWHVQSGAHAILIDPLLTDTFGAARFSHSSVIPHRLVDITAMGELSAVILSHDHPDHFCPISLSLLNRHIPVVTSVLFPRYARELLEAAGFSVRALPFEEPTTVGHLQITLYACGKDTPFWERNVAQVLIQDGCACYMAVDGALSTSLTEAIKVGAVPRPICVIIANNSQLAPYSELAPFESVHLNDEQATQKNGAVQLRIISELLEHYESVVDSGGLTLISGGGFTRCAEDDMRFRPFNKLADSLSILSARGIANVRVSSPGDVYDIAHTGWSQGPTALWINLLSVNQYAAIDSSNSHAQTNDDIVNFQTFDTAFRVRFQHDFAKRCLPLLQQSDFGRAVFYQASRDGTNGTFEMVFQLDYLEHQHEGMERIIFYLENGEFQLRSGPPTGDVWLKMRWSSFVAVHAGEFEFWDLAGREIEQAYYGEALESPIAFFYSYFSPEIHSDIAEAGLLARWTAQK